MPDSVRSNWIDHWEVSVEDSRSSPARALDPWRIVFSQLLIGAAGLWVAGVEIAILWETFSKYRILSALWHYGMWHINPFGLLTYVPAAVLWWLSTVVRPAAQ